jgi:alkylated DNA repair dioxygenase AlkB
VLRDRAERRQRLAVVLPHGSLLLMAGRTQALYQHALPKTRRVQGPRINLTFRRILRGAAA